MSRKNIIALCSLIAVMLLIIVAAVCYLYSGVNTPSETPATDVSEEEEVLAVNVPQEKSAPEPEVTPEPAPQQTPQPTEFKVKNSATGKMNTLRQNKNNSLTLIDHNGKALWTVTFPGKMVGEPAQIDIYNNLKIQYLIAERDKLHLIDRLGREVKHFPLTLPGTALSGPKDVKSGKTVYWQIETSAGTVYFDKQNVKITNQLP